MFELLQLLRAYLEFSRTTYAGHQSLFEALASGQSPHICLVSCIDSRVMASHLFGVEPGNTLSQRNPGAIIPEPGYGHSEAATIEYALTLGVKTVVVCGHYGCGAVNALLHPESLENLPALSKWLEQANDVKQIMDEKYGHLSEEERWRLGVEINVLTQMNRLETLYPEVKKRVAQGELHIMGCIFDIPTGRMLTYDSYNKQFISIQEFIVQELVREEFLHVFANPQNAHEYHLAMQAFHRLKHEGIASVWENLSAHVSQRLFQELEGFYQDTNSLEFLALLEYAQRTPLPPLENFQKNIQRSSGYHQFCNQHVAKSSFFSFAPSREAANHVQNLEPKLA